MSDHDVKFAFPKPYAHVAIPDPAVNGYYAWRISVEGASFELIFGTPSPVALRDMEKVLRVSEIRLCPSARVLISECTERIEGSAKLTKDVMELRVTDPRVISLLRRERPAAYWRYIYLPGGRFRIDQIEFKY